jgi:hypothetical protein
LRLELFEIDTRFGELGPNGIFNTLDRAGVLRHHFTGIDNIPHAVISPPAIGRAKVRGDAIERLHANPNRFACDWSVIVDGESKVALDLRDPWACNEQWVAEVPMTEERLQFMPWRQRRRVGVPPGGPSEAQP